jgi:hypothetical protein
VSNTHPKKIEVKLRQDFHLSSSFPNNRTFFRGKDAIQISIPCLASPLPEQYKLDGHCLIEHSAQNSIIGTDSVEHSPQLPTCALSGKLTERWTAFELKGGKLI